MDKAKPFCIPKREVWEAYKRVKANQGAAGIDGQSIDEFEEDLSNNLYRLWNRLSSGSYFPPPVRRVDIPKGEGKTRPLGIPTVSDRIAQMVVRRYLEPILEPVFHEDSYGYRPGRSAHQALSVARQRCWRYDWVLDLDVKGFFDTIDWNLLMRAVRRHTDCKWVLLYIERWLHAPVSMPDGTLVRREQGTPQGAVVSPILANLFLHVRHEVVHSFVRDDLVFCHQYPTKPCVGGNAGVRSAWDNVVSTGGWAEYSREESVAVSRKAARSKGWRAWPTYVNRHEPSLRESVPKRLRGTNQKVCSRVGVSCSHPTQTMDCRRKVGAYPL